MLRASYRNLLQPPTRRHPLLAPAAALMSTTATTTAQSPSSLAAAAKEFIEAPLYYFSGETTDGAHLASSLSIRVPLPAS